MFLVGILILPSSVQALDLKLTYNEKWNECVDDVWTLSSYDNAGNVDGNLVIYNSKQLKQMVILLVLVLQSLILIIR